MSGKGNERDFLSLSNVLFLGLGDGLFILWKFTELYACDLCTFWNACCYISVQRFIKETYKLSSSVGATEIYKSYQNSWQEVDIYRTQKSGQTNILFQKWFSQTGSNVLWCLILKGKMTFVREITTVIICFLFNLAIVSIMKTRLGPRPFAHMRSQRLFS